MYVFPAEKSTPLVDAPVLLFGFMIIELVFELVVLIVTTPLDPPTVKELLDPPTVNPVEVVIPSF